MRAKVLSSLVHFAVHFLVEEEEVGRKLVVNEVVSSIELDFFFVIQKNT